MINTGNKIFKKGDKVVCISDKGWNDELTEEFVLRKYMILEVQDVIVFCGKQSIDIGARFSDPTRQTKQFFNGQPIPGDGIHWASSDRFLLVEEQEIEIYNKLLLNNLKQELKRSINDENFELSIILRDTIRNGGIFKKN